MLSTGIHVPRSIIASDASDCTGTYTYNENDGEGDSTVATGAYGEYSEVETSAWTKLGMALLLVDPRDDNGSCCFPGSLVSSSCGDGDGGSTVATGAYGEYSEVETSLTWTKLGMALLLVDPRDDNDSCCFPASMVSSSCCDSSSTCSDYSTASNEYCVDDDSRSTIFHSRGARNSYRDVSSADAQPVNLERYASRSITTAIITLPVEDKTQEATHAKSATTSTENKATTLSSIMLPEVISTTPEEREACINIPASKETAPKNQPNASQATRMAVFRLKLMSLKIRKKIPSFSHSPRTHQQDQSEKDLRILVNEAVAKGKKQEAKAMYRIEVVLREEDLASPRTRTNKMAELKRNLFQRK